MVNNSLQAFRRKHARVRHYRGPYHVWSNVAVGVTSIRRDDHFEVSDAETGGRTCQNGRYYVLVGCTPLHLISGVDHILVSTHLRDILHRHCRESVNFEALPVRDSATGREVTGYLELQLP